MISQIFFWTLLFSGIIYLGFALYLHTGISKLKPPPPDKSVHFSVLVTAHNEQENIAACIDSLLAQDYPEQLLEIILINDRSSDKTGDIMQQYVRKFNHLKFMQIDETPPEFSPKKYALTKGMTAATGEWIVTTDADCTPSPSWLGKLAGYAATDAGMLIGPAPLMPNGTFVSKMTALDSLVADSIAAGTAGWNRAIQSTGRNFGYRKELVEEINGFDGVQHVLSGDDTLLLHKARNATNCKATFVADPDVAVASPAPQYLHERFHQRRRHVNGSLYFPRRIQAGYFLHHLSNTLIWLGSIYYLLAGYSIIFPLGILAGKFLLDFSILARSAGHSNQHALLKWFLPWEFFYVLEQLTISPMGFIGKIRW